MKAKHGFFTSLRCRECGRCYPKEALHVCEFCFGPLEVDYDYDAIKSLITKIHKSFEEFVKLGLVDKHDVHIHGAQAEDCAPIVNTVKDGDEISIIPAIAGGCR